MKLPTNFLAILLLGALLTFFSACNYDETMISPDPKGSFTDEAAMKLMIETDEEINSFEPNYDEDDFLDFGLGKISTTVYPIRVKHKMFLVNKTVNILEEGDSATALITKEFDGKLFILASYTEFEKGDSIIIDTLIEKNFSTTMTRYVILERKNDTDTPDSNWYIAAVSLPEGGTLNSGINIQKITVTFSNGDTLAITSPNEYFLERRPGKTRRIPQMLRNRDVSVRVEILSPYPDADIVTLTYGALRHARHFRSKKLFELVSEKFDGQNYIRIYKQTYRTHERPGPRHAIITALAYQSVHDDAAEVVENTWGIPYVVH